MGREVRMAQGADDKSRRTGSRRGDRLADEFAEGFHADDDGDWLASLRDLAPPADDDEAAESAEGATDAVEDLEARLAGLAASLAEVAFTGRSILLMLGSGQAALERLEERVQGLASCVAARNVAVDALHDGHREGLDALASSLSELSAAVADLASRPAGPDQPDGPVWDEVTRSARRLVAVAGRRMRTGTQSGRPGDRIASQLREGGR